MGCMAKTKVLGTGLSGLVGSRIIELLQDEYDFENLSLETGIDITDRQQVEQKINRSQAKVILHLAAKADVDGCEKDKPLGKKGNAWRINVEGTKNIVDTAKKAKKKIIYISTDFVFDGENAPYVEDDVVRPINWYGQTKYEGEKVVASSGLPFIIARIAYPYRANFPLKQDFVRAIRNKLEQGDKIRAVADHIMTPTLIDDIAVALDRLIKENATGIYHVVGGEFISPYDAAIIIANAFGFSALKIVQTTRKEYFAHRATRPFNLSLKNDKIQKLGVKMKTFKEGLLSL